jgi:antitoxin (DNA-binding transcriptional repressor) of toxin-antitoxin stability system
MRIVAALGGNALLQRGEHPDATVREAHVHQAASTLAELALAGHELIITHGNGPKIRLLALARLRYTVTVSGSASTGSTASSPLTSPMMLSGMFAWIPGWIGAANSPVTSHAPVTVEFLTAVLSASVEVAVKVTMCRPWAVLPVAGTNALRNYPMVSTGVPEVLLLILVSARLAERSPPRAQCCPYASPMASAARCRGLDGPSGP